MINKWLIFMSVAVLLFGTVNVFAWIENCDYGRAKAWIQLQDKKWQEVPIEGITLKVGEPFKVKIEVQIYISGNIHIGLSEPGATLAYDVIDGPSSINDLKGEYQLYPGWNKTYIWTIVPNGNWVEGTAPLNGGVWFVKGPDDMCEVGGGILLAYISSEKWEGNGNEGDSGKESHGGIPGFELSLLILAFLVMWRYRK